VPDEDVTDFKGYVRDRVSRETFEKLEAFTQLVLKWNRKINLIGRSTADQVWKRHIADGLQLTELAYPNSTWVDLGSGAGIPGLIIAAKKAETAKSPDITLVESDERKCIFLAAAAREMDLTVDIQQRRIEEPTSKRYDVVSARALAPLDQLLTYAEPYLSDNGICLFPKGEKADSELTQARESFHISMTKIQSVTDSSASILRVQEFSRV